MPPAMRRDGRRRPAGLHGLLSAIARRAVGTITRVLTAEPLLALTFDDGPDPQFTPRLLDILERFGARGTFFMVGQAAACQPDLVRRLALADHAIGNHSWDHAALPLLARHERREQIRAGQRATLPYGQRLLRPPYGYQSVASHLDALRMGYQVVGWNHSANDWLGREPGPMVERLATKLRRGGILLFHDGLYTFQDARYADRTPTLRAVEGLLERLGGEYQFVTVPELLRHGRPQRQHWYRAPDLAYLNRLWTAQGEARRYPQPGARPAEKPQPRETTR